MLGSIQCAPHLTGIQVNHSRASKDGSAWGYTSFIRTLRQVSIKECKEVEQEINLRMETLKDELEIRRETRKACPQAILTEREKIEVPCREVMEPFLRVWRDGVPYPIPVE